MDLKTVFLRFRIKEEEWSCEILVLTLTQPWVTSLEERKQRKTKMEEKGKWGVMRREEEDGILNFLSFLFPFFVFPSFLFPSFLYITFSFPFPSF